MKRHFKPLWIIVALLLFLFPQAAMADGMVVAPETQWIEETDQQAVIFYDQGVETLILSISFQGDAEDFGWIVPVPSKPEIAKGSDELFTTLEELTGYVPYPSKRILYEDSYLGSADQAVTIVETKKIDYYDVTVLSSTDEKALAEWFSDNDYNYPTAASYLLNSYIENGWYFVAMKINPESLGWANVTQQLRSGHATPVSLAFETNNIVYPMKISSIVNRDNNPYYQDIIEELGSVPEYYSSVTVQIYAIAENRKTLPSFSTDYANWINKESIQKLAVDDQGDPLLQPSDDKYFLTKLTSYMYHEDMTEDLFLRDASTNGTIGDPIDVGGPTTATPFYIMIIVAIVISIGFAVVILVLSKRPVNKQSNE